MSKSQRDKGKRGELEAAKLLVAVLGLPARRGQQYQGTPESPDVQWIPGVAVEVKRREAGNPARWLAEALAECLPSDVAMVLHRRSRQPWHLTMRVQDLGALIDRVLEARRISAGSG